MNKIYIYSFSLILGGLLLLFICTPNQNFSEFENRTLASSISFSWDKLWSSELSENIESVVTDQFPFREQWVKAYAASEQLRGVVLNNGIANASHQFLMKPIQEPSWDELSSYIESLNILASGDHKIPTHLMLIPTSVGMYPQYLPKWVSSYPQISIHQYIAQQLDEQVSFWDGFSLLADNYSLEQQNDIQAIGDDNNQLYYYTDHHWTTHAAYEAYAAFMKNIGYEPIEKSSFEITTVSNNFYGSHHTASPYFGITADQIVKYSLPSLQSSMYIADTDEWKDSLYDEQYLQTKDQYRYFMGGVHALVQIYNEWNKPANLANDEIVSAKAIEATNDEEGKTFDFERVLVIKDSYAHSFIPFLSAHAKEVHVIDPRYYGGIISQYIEQYDFDFILLLYNTETFIDERSLLQLKY